MLKSSHFKVSQVLITSRIEFRVVVPGKCLKTTYNPELIRTYFRFIGIQTRNYLDLRFTLELEDDLKNHKILDIFGCFCFRGDEIKDWTAPPPS